MESDMSKQVLSISRRLPLGNTGGSIPQLGYGVYQSPAATTTATTLHALSVGYRHVDTAGIYRNEHSVCAAVNHFLKTNPNISRSEIFYSTKFAPHLKGYPAAKNSIAQSLSYIRNPLEIDDDKLKQPAVRPDGKERVGFKEWKAFDRGDEEPLPEDSEKGLGYIDLYLIHAPSGTLSQRNGAWKAIVEAKKRGEVKHLGVSNYSVVHMEQLQEFIAQEEERGLREGKGEGWGGRIDVWQGEIHPWLSRHDIRDYCKRHDIVIQAYSPLVRATRFNDPLLQPLVEKYGRTPAQILLRWSIQLGFVPLPKSEKNERIEENANIYGFELSEQDIKDLDTGLYEPCAWDPTVWDPNS